MMLVESRRARSVAAGHFSLAGKTISYDAAADAFFPKSKFSPGVVLSGEARADITTRCRGSCCDDDPLIRLPVFELVVSLSNLKQRVTQYESQNWRPNEHKL